MTLIHPSTLARLPANQPTVEGHVCRVVRAFPRSPMHSNSSITGKGVPRLHSAGCRACRVCRVAAWHMAWDASKSSRGQKLGRMGWLRCFPDSVPDVKVAGRRGAPRSYIVQARGRGLEKSVGEERGVVSGVSSLSPCSDRHGIARVGHGCGEPEAVGGRAGGCWVLQVSRAQLLI